MHQSAAEFLVRWAIGPDRWGFVVEFGSRDVNGTIRPWVDTHRYVGVDLERGAGVDVVADAATYTPSGRPDLIVCAELLEHCSWAEKVVANAGRILRPGGLFLMTCATDPRAPHGVNGGEVGTEHYQNIDPDLFNGWVGEWGDLLDIQIDRDAGDLRAAAQKRVR